MEPDVTTGTDMTMCSQCGGVMKQEGDVMKCELCQHTEPLTPHSAEEASEEAPAESL